MDRYPRYLWFVAGYMTVLIIASTAVTSWLCGMDATDSLYFVVQTLWTVGYGDVVPAGEEGRAIAVAVMLFGTVGITSALGVVGGMVLDRHTRRHEELESELEETRRMTREALYRWGEEHGHSKEAVDRFIEEVKHEQG